MAEIDAQRELTLLEQKLDQALGEFGRMPGAMWLATSSIIEAVGRLGAVPDGALAQRQSELLLRARKARDDAGPRSSEHDVSAITAWLELAQKRAPLELEVKTALAKVAEHRRANPALGDAPKSREELERALAARELDVVERERRLATPVPAGAAELVQKIRASDPDLDPALVGDTEIWTRGAAAASLLEKAGMKERWSRARFPSAALLTTLAFVAATACLVAAYRIGETTGDGELVALAAAGAAVVGLGLLAAAYSRRGSERALGEAMSDYLAFRERDETRLTSVRRDQELLVAAAKALGRLDAFGATEDGRTLDARETRLATLAPWIRETVGGFDAEDAKRFAP